jgi:hypothetical protein
VQPLHTAIAKRIGWFLYLQRVLEFPKYFWAPQPAPLRRRSSTRDDFSAHRSGNVGIAEEPFFAATPGHISALEYLRPRTLSRTTASPDILSDRMTALTTIMKIFRHVQAQSAFWSDRTFMKSTRAQLENVSQSKILGLEYTRALRRQRVRHGEADGLTTSGRRFAVSQKLRFPGAADPGAPQFGMAQSRSANVGVEAILRVQPPPRQDMTDSGQLTGEGNQSCPRGPDRASGYGSQQRTSAAASTLHLDGSVLGRWAIQHLERTLGKPAAGMTGVDPRASLPRSRVSPF